VRTFVDWAFSEASIKLRWEGKGEEERGIDTLTGKTLVQIDPKYFRPAEVDLLVGDASKAERVLGWKPKLTVEQLCREMVAADLKTFSKDKYLIDGGHQVNQSQE
jgi:GDPmannose 4,6-dehydratase